MYKNIFNSNICRTSPSSPEHDEQRLFTRKQTCELSCIAQLQEVTSYNKRDSFLTCILARKVTKMLNNAKLYDKETDECLILYVLLPNELSILCSKL